MNVADFDYHLPDDRIAQVPCERRDASRLLTLDPVSGATGDLRFDALPELLHPDDLLLLNDTRVLPARLVGRKASGGRVELLLLEALDEPRAGEATWNCWLKASRGSGVGTRMRFSGGLSGEVVGREQERWQIRLSASAGPLREALERSGRMPLPPYIRRADDDADGAKRDRERYQTVFAERPGAVAAPTAGLHFTEALLEAIAARGVAIARLTLHVGPGTFQPIRTERVEDHRMHAEWFELPDATAVAVDEARRRGGRVVAVGTTVVRTLESQAEVGGRVRPGRGRSDLFIRPGHRFRVVDAMVTNFHLPRSTLLMLVSAFAGRERILEAYRHAVRQGYRFYSYGDAMWIGRPR